jgi:hypothetical protein
MASQSTRNTSAQSPPPSETAPQPGSRKTVWYYDGGAYRVESPEPLPRATWEKLKRYIELLEPDDKDRQGGST